MCFVCDGAHFVRHCSWLPTVQDMVKNALTGGLLRPTAAAAAVDDGKLQEVYDERDECFDAACAMAAGAGDRYVDYEHENEDWLQNVRT
jgi:hypothetical protein